MTIQLHHWHAGLGRILVRLTAAGRSGRPVRPRTMTARMATRSGFRGTWALAPAARAASGTSPAHYLRCRMDNPGCGSFQHCHHCDCAAGGLCQLTPAAAHPVGHCIRWCVRPDSVPPLVRRLLSGCRPAEDCSVGDTPTFSEDADA